MATPNFNLEQPVYLSDGEIAVGQINDNMSIIDDMYTYIIVNRMDGTIITDRLSGEPILNRLAVGG